MEENLERNVEKDKKKMLVIIILSLLVGLLLGYIIFDKFISPKEDNKKPEVKDPINNDLPSSSSSKDITSEEENNETENTVRELDINSTLVKSLVYPKMSSLHDQILDVQWHYNDIKVSTMPDELKIENANDESQWIFEEIGGGTAAYITSNNVKSNYMKIFGPDSIFPNPNNLKYSEIKLCGGIDGYDSNYDKFKIAYGCGGDSDFFILTKSKTYKAEMIDDKIFVYDYYVYYLEITKNAKPFMHYFKSNPIEGKDFKFKLETGTYDIKSFADGSNLEADFNKMISENQISTYKYTFQKQSDGKYYFTSGETIR